MAMKLLTAICPSVESVLDLLYIAYCLVVLNIIKHTDASGVRYTSFIQVDINAFKKYILSGCSTKFHIALPG